jgi:hypothetical protein
MEKQKAERIMQMIQSNETLRKQYQENKEETINIMYAWLDAEEKGIDLDPYFSRRQALEFTIQKLEHDFKVLREKGNVVESELIAREMLIKKRTLAILGKEEENIEEVAEIKRMQLELEEDRKALTQPKENNIGPTL